MSTRRASSSMRSTRDGMAKMPADRPAPSIAGPPRTSERGSEAVAMAAAVHLFQVVDQGLALCGGQHVGRIEQGFRQYLRGAVGQPADLAAQLLDGGAVDRIGGEGSDHAVV